MPQLGTWIVSYRLRGDPGWRVEEIQDYTLALGHVADLVKSVDVLFLGQAAILIDVATIPLDEQDLSKLG